ncbi:2TM domain-containing protein [Hyphomicrobium sp.]|uniref:2TM domain-containing protein n=1 Tax=Hyphomicrobium sp. TaxID=82 RepID=UPI003F70A1A0
MAFSFKQFSSKDLRVDALREGGVLLHAKIFAAVMIGLVFIDWYTAEPYWAHWVFLGWGAGLLLHTALALRH